MPQSVAACRRRRWPARCLWEARWSTPPFPKHGRPRLVDFPVEKIIIARPRVDLAPANLTAETARMLVWMLLPCRGVRQPAVGTAKIFGRPYATCHLINMRPRRPGSKPFPLLQLSIG